VKFRDDVDMKQLIKVSNCSRRACPKVSNENGRKLKKQSTKHRSV